VRRVPFSLVPAIDLTANRLGLLTPDGPVPHDGFGGDPLAAADAFVAAGATWLHVVDMDRAFTGTARSGDAVRQIVSRGVRVQLSGGIRTVADVDAARATGAARIVLSSSALADEDAVAELLRPRQDDLVIGIEVVEGRIRPRGAAAVDLDLMSTLGWFRTAGVGAFLVTAVSRVATGVGPDLDLIRRAVRSGVATMAAGGVASIADLQALRDAGAAGAVVGRAALEGSLDLSAAFAWARA
jgi:phosphoribosylformimino-5-aminoimidazole carboxamide ribonucleotide (ProFAR) isomerase